MNEEDLKEALAALLDEDKPEGVSGTCNMKDCGAYQPRHEFRRLACTECGGLHWENDKKTLPKMRYCPWCGKRVGKWIEKGRS